jgi:hypothetical protein
MLRTDESAKASYAARGGRNAEALGCRTHYLAATGLMLGQEKDLPVAPAAEPAGQSCNYYTDGTRGDTPLWTDSGCSAPSSAWASRVDALFFFLLAVTGAVALLVAVLDSWGCRRRGATGSARRTWCTVSMVIAARKGGRPVNNSGKLSALDAAARVLGEEGRAMNCKELIETMAAKGYWRGQPATHLGRQHLAGNPPVSATSRMVWQRAIGEAESLVLVHEHLTACRF